VEKTFEEKISSRYYYTQLDHRSEHDREAYWADKIRLEEEFKQDALKAAGLLGHPKADKAYSMAWADGHSSGYNDVFYYLERFADLLLND
jgi:hypothetical protein